MTFQPQANPYKRFPPGHGPILIPMADRASALGALGLFTPVRWRARMAGRIARAFVRIGGPATLPGRAFEWQSPIPPEVWDALGAEWTARWGPIDTLAVYERPDINRPGLALLFMRAGRPLGFAKVRHTDVESLLNEARAMRLVWRHQPRSFRIPEPVIEGEISGWHYLGMAPLPRGSHTTPGTTSVHRIIEDIQAALQDLPRGPDIPEHWRPMHGDFSPGNLRRLKDGGLVLIDWEYAGWGPPRADEVMYSLTSAVTMGSEANQIDAAEAIDFWHDRISSWPDADDHVRNRRYRRAMLGALEKAAGRALTKG